MTSDVTMLTSSEGTRTLDSRILSSHIDHHLGSDHVHYVAPCFGVGSPMLLVPSFEIFYPQLSNLKSYCHYIFINKYLTSVLKSNEKSIIVDFYLYLCRMMLSKC